MAQAKVILCDHYYTERRGPLAEGVRCRELARYRISICGDSRTLASMCVHHVGFAFVAPRASYTIDRIDY